MDELPAIIHRLSLQLWCPDQANKGIATPLEDMDEEVVDPFASPPLDPVDANGNLLDANAISELSLNGGGEVQSLFSQRNLLCLAALNDSHRTLSLFTPNIRDVVFRAWSGYGDRSGSATPAIATPSLAKSYAGSSTTYTFSDSASTGHGCLPSRPSLISLNSATLGLTPGSSHRSRPGRKKKNRVVNLRGSKSEANSVNGDSESSSVTDTASIYAPCSEPMANPIAAETETTSTAFGETGASTVRFRPPLQRTSPLAENHSTEHHKPTRNVEQTVSATPKTSKDTVETVSYGSKGTTEKEGFTREHSYSNSETPSVILEQAWIMKMAGEIARRVYDEKQSQQRGWDDAESAPPPAYEAAARPVV